MAEDTRRSPRVAAGWAARAAMLLGGVGLALRVALPRPSPAGMAPGDASGEIGRGRPHEAPSRGSRAAGYELADVHAGIIYKLMGLFVALAALVAVGMIGLQHLVLQRQAANLQTLTAEQLSHPVPPAPGLQANPVSELDALEAAQHALLTQYAWVDRAHTAARIPIGQAKALIVGHELDTAP